MLASKLCGKREEQTRSLTEETVDDGESTLLEPAFRMPKADSSCPAVASSHTMSRSQETDTEGRSGIMKVQTKHRKSYKWRSARRLTGGQRQACQAARRTQSEEAQASGWQGAVAGPTSKDAGSLSAFGVEGFTPRGGKPALRVWFSTPHLSARRCPHNLRRRCPCQSLGVPCAEARQRAPIAVLLLRQDQSLERLSALR